MPGRRRLIASSALLVASGLPLLTGCSPEPEAGAAEHPAVGSASSPTTTDRASVTSPTSSTTSSTSSTTSTAPAATTTLPPTFTDRFAAAVDDVGMEAAATPIPDSARDSVARLWLLLGRPPTEDELQAGVRAIVVEGRPLTSLADLLLRSPESVLPEPEAPPLEFVSALFAAVHERPGTAAELTPLVRQLERGAAPGAMVVLFTESPAAVQRTGTLPPGLFPTLELVGVGRVTSDSVLRLYTGLLGRFPTRAELTAGVERVRSGRHLAALADELIASSEYRGDRGDTTDQAFVDDLYTDVLGRPADRAGVAYWAAQLELGVSRGAVAAALTESPEYVERTGTEPPPPAPPVVPGDGVLAVGDSVMLGALHALEDAIPGIVVDAKVSRQFDEGLSIVSALAEQGVLPDTVVFHLGANGSVGGDRCDELLTLLAGHRVVLLNVRVPRPWEAPNNELLAACAQRHGAQLVDWHSGATGLAADGVHIGPEGARQYAALVAAALAEPAVAVP
jgi:hypothetical protein